MPLLPLVLVPPFVPLLVALLLPPNGARAGAGVVVAGIRYCCVAGAEKP